MSDASAPSDRGPRGLRALVASPAPAAGGVPDEIVAALRVGDADADIQLVHDVETGRAVLASGAPLDCWIVDEALGPALLAWIDVATRAGAPPCIAIAREGGEAFALAAHRAGACGSVGGDGLAARLRSEVDAVLARRAAQASVPSPSLAGLAGADGADALAGTTRDIIRTMNSALWVLDRNGRISFANPAAAQIVGVSPGELVGLPISHFFQGRAAAQVPIWRSLEFGEQVRGAETVLTREDGRIVPVGLSAAPLERAGERAGAVVIFQDLTEVKQLERHALQTEKMASIGQLAAGVAHEINNPMGFIHANLCQLTEYIGDLGRVFERVEVLRKVAGSERVDPSALREAAAELDGVIAEVDASFLLEDFGKAIQESLEGSERVRVIVQDLRAFSHQDTAERALTDVNKALDSTANIVWTMMKHSVRLTKEYAELPAISCFPVPLKQVFMNLMINAYQAIEERAEFDAEHRGEIRLRTERVDDGVQIIVSDNGAGIRPELIARVFDPFFTTKEVGAGTGLGLSTSFNLIERHAGTLQVESELGRGSSFRVWLPIAGPAGASVA